MQLRLFSACVVLPPFIFSFSIVCGENPRGSRGKGSVLRVFSPSLDVGELYGAIHRKNHCSELISPSESNSVIHWMEIYSMDSINIHHFKTLNQTCVNWGWERRQT